MAAFDGFGPDHLGAVGALAHPAGIHIRSLDSMDIGAHEKGDQEAKGPQQEPESEAAATASTLLVENQRRRDAHEYPDDKEHFHGRAPAIEPLRSVTWLGPIVKRWTARLDFLPDQGDKHRTDVEIRYERLVRRQALSSAEKTN